MQVDSLKRFQKCSLRDGPAKVFAYTFVVDPEPLPPQNIVGAVCGDYILVAGKKSKTLPGMTVVATWETYQLFLKPNSNNLAYADWPGVLMPDYSFFKSSVTPGKLATMDTFLIQKGHVSSVLKDGPVARKKKKNL